MNKIVAIANQKGGVGKTTTAVNLSASLGAAECRVLLVDIDPQANASSGVGVVREEGESTIYEVLIGEISAEEAIVKTDLLDIIPSSPRLIGAEIELVSQIAREMKLKNSLSGIRDRYDYIIVDAPPSLGLLTLNTLINVTRLLIENYLYFTGIRINAWKFWAITNLPQCSSNNRWNTLFNLFKKR